MTRQEEIYSSHEANSFFLRCSDSLPSPGILRESKKYLVDLLLKANSSLRGQRVLEVGCFIGDLLAYLRDHYDCEVYGVEASSLACQHASSCYSLNLDNATFTSSKFFGFDSSLRSTFDLIVVEDVFGWMSRETILPVVASIDWLLKPGGQILIHDYSPAFGFCYRNHHVRDADVYSFKQPGGHSTFFVATGMYFVECQQTRLSSAYQKVQTGRPDSTSWATSILRKLEAPLHPVLSL